MPRNFWSAISALTEELREFKNAMVEAIERLIEAIEKAGKEKDKDE